MKYKSVIILLLVLTHCNNAKEAPCPSKKCSDYASQQAAQDDFDLDKKCLSNLDADKDGQACEELNSGVGIGTSGCPTTANCGCSNKSQALCASSCCKWVVGSGCKCN